jgi:eukaryotic-like serine/threonine-protein kinase
MKFQTGACIGPYVVEEPLGQGGMGEVYRALDPRLNRQVAIKVLPDDFASDFDRLRRFDQEAKAIAQLSHPNIVQIFDVGLQENSSVQKFL